MITLVQLELVKFSVILVMCIVSSSPCELEFPFKVRYINHKLHLPLDHHTHMKVVE